MYLKGAFSCGSAEQNGNCRIRLRTAAHLHIPLMAIIHHNQFGPKGNGTKTLPARAETMSSIA